MYQKDDGSYMLGVHIADVSHYVRENTYLDREALLRGTSVYFTDYTVHMLPEKLSTDICSLKENADRLTLSVLMNISKTGEFISHEIFPSVIRNKKRFNYKEVQEILDDQNGPYLRELNLLSQLARLLHDIRHKKGSIDFDIPEPEFELDEKGVPTYMRFKERLWSHQIIEECMLMANKTVARYIRKEKHKMPFIYRVHDIPEYERIQEWFSYMELLGIKVTRFGIPVTPGKFQRAFEEALHQNNSAFIKQTALQVMMKAKYATEPLGHFGLACKDYTHFTSPIRRYPDLIVHRLLKKYLMNNKPDLELEDHLDTVARISSEAEQRALSAQRVYDKIKQMRFLKTKTGEISEGIITNVTAQGLQVELRDSCIEGFVPLYSLKNDYWYFDDRNLTLTGRRTQSRYKIGDIVTVRIVQIDIQQLKAEFCLEN